MEQLTMDSSDATQFHSDVRLAEAAAADISHIPAQRRRKQFVPDGAKDDSYWAKRKKNNMAARRSRENRRKLEVDIRQRMLDLQEENLLLKLELDTIKRKFKLSTKLRFLSLSDDGDLVPQVGTEHLALRDACAESLWSDDATHDNHAAPCKTDASYEIDRQMTSPCNETMHADALNDSCQATAELNSKQTVLGEHRDSTARATNRARATAHQLGTENESRPLAECERPVLQRVMSYDDNKIPVKKRRFRNLSSIDEDDANKCLDLSVKRVRSDSPQRDPRSTAMPTLIPLNGFLPRCNRDLTLREVLESASQQSWSSPGSSSSGYHSGSDRGSPASHDDASRTQLSPPRAPHHILPGPTIEQDYVSQWHSMTSLPQQYFQQLSELRRRPYNHLHQPQI